MQFKYYGDCHFFIKIEEIHYNCKIIKAKEYIDQKWYKAEVRKPSVLFIFPAF